MSAITALSELFLNSSNVQFRCREQVIHVYLSKLACKWNERVKIKAMWRNYDEASCFHMSFLMHRDDKMIYWTLDIHLTWCRYSYSMHVKSGFQELKWIHLCSWTNLNEIVTYLNRDIIYNIHISSSKIYCRTIISQVSSLAYKPYHIATSHILANKIYL